MMEKSNSKRTVLGICLSAVSVLVLAMGIYTGWFFNQTDSRQQCLDKSINMSSSMAVPYIECTDETTDANHYLTFVTTPEGDGVPKLRVYRERRLFGLIDVGRYAYVMNAGAELEKVGYAACSADGGQTNLSFFYSPNDAQIEKLECTYSKMNETYTVNLNCNPFEPFVRGVVLENSGWKIQSINGYNQSGENVYTFLNNI